MSALDGYGLGGSMGCVIDLADPELRHAAIADGIIWSGPMAAQWAAVYDLASRRVPMPEAAVPDWALNVLDWYASHPDDQVPEWYRALDGGAHR